MASPLILEDVPGSRIIFKNFDGREAPFNSKGDRNFSIIFDEEKAKELRDQGWNMKELKRRDDEDEQKYHLKVKVNFNGRKPPRCVLVSDGGKRYTELEDHNVGLIDAADIEKVDISINPYDYVINRGSESDSGRSAYLKSILVYLLEDPVDQKFAAIQESVAGHGYPVEDMDNAAEAVLVGSNGFDPTSEDGSEAD